MSKGTGRRRRRSRGEWAVIVERFASSGLDARTFCARERIGYTSFCSWRRKLAQKATTTTMAVPSISSPIPFIDLGPMASAAGVAWEVELELGGAVVLRLKHR